MNGKISLDQENYNQINYAMQIKRITKFTEINQIWKWYRCKIRISGLITHEDRYYNPS